MIERVSLSRKNLDELINIIANSHTPLSFKELTALFSAVKDDVRPLVMQADPTEEAKNPGY